MRFKRYIVALSFLALVGVGLSHKSAVGQKSVEFYCLQE